MVQPGGMVYGMDYLPGLVRLSERNIRKADGDLLDHGVVVLVTKSGWEGWEEHAPYDAIHVGAAAVEIPGKLVEQLKVGGRMIIPLGPDGGSQVGRGVRGWYHYYVLLLLLLVLQ